MSLVRKRVAVPLPPQDAFDLFTRGIDRWWPRDRPDTAAGLRIEPRRGGRVIETAADGTETERARVTAWHPGRRLALAWTTDAPVIAHSQVVVTFTAEATGTRVDLTHGDFTALSRAAHRRDHRTMRAACPVPTRLAA